MIAGEPEIAPPSRPPQMPPSGAGLWKGRKVLSAQMPTDPFNNRPRYGLQRIEPGRDEVQRCVPMRGGPETSTTPRLTTGGKSVCRRPISDPSPGWPASEEDKHRDNDKERKAGPDVDAKPEAEKRHRRITPRDSGTPSYGTVARSAQSCAEDFPWEELAGSVVTLRVGGGDFCGGSAGGNGVAAFAAFIALAVPAAGGLPPDAVGPLVDYVCGSSAEDVARGRDAAAAVLSLPECVPLRSLLEGLLSGDAARDLDLDTSCSPHGSSPSSASDGGIADRERDEPSVDVAADPALVIVINRREDVRDGPELLLFGDRVWVVSCEGASRAEEWVLADIDRTRSRGTTVMVQSRGDIYHHHHHHQPETSRRQHFVMVPVGEDSFPGRRTWEELFASSCSVEDFAVTAARLPGSGGLWVRQRVSRGYPRACDWGVFDGEGEGRGVSNPRER